MVGQSVGHYRIVAELGAGGMGVVYRAIDERLHRPVAIKALPASLTGDEERRRRFVQEAHAASALNDPHIITIHDICSEQGADYIVMELVQGRTLRELAAGRPMPERTVLDLVAQIADGLSVAHEAGIVHRDLKPGNLMVTNRGHVKVLDFGLAKLTRADAEQATLDAPLTRAGTVLGTIEYMAPEQVSGGAVDLRADIFALGAVTYELLTAVRPFQGDHVIALMHAILYGSFTPIRTLRPDVSEPLDQLITCMLAREPAARPQTMALVAEECRRLRQATATAEALAAPGAVTVALPAAPSGAPLIQEAERPSTLMRAVGAAKRRPALLFASAVVVLMPVAWLTTRASMGTGATTSTGADASRMVPGPGATASEITAYARTLARRFDRADSLAASVQAFEQAIARDAAHAPAWAGLSRAYWRQFRASRDQPKAAQALDTARKAVSLDPYLAEGYVTLGLAQLATGDHAQATASFDRALALDPRNAQAHRGLGEVAEAQDRREDAQAAYERAVSFDASDWELPRLAGNIHFRAGRYQEALEWYKQAAALATDVATPHALVGGTYHMLGDYPNAAEALQRAIAIQPTGSIYSNLGTTLFFQGRYQDAVAAFEKAVGMLPNDPLLWGNLGDAYANVPAGREKAQEAYLRAVQLLDQQVAREPANVMALSRLALYLAKQGNVARARTVLDGIPDLSTRDLNTLYRAAVTSEILAQRDQALRWLELALQGGYPMHEVAGDPSLAPLRADVRYHRLALRFEPTPATGAR
jgi:tetratricopeptide (TPR) repeat protein/predicted Ser/Thr protein kinase